MFAGQVWVHGAGDELLRSPLRGFGSLHTLTHGSRRGLLSCAALRLFGGDGTKIVEECWIGNAGGIGAVDQRFAIRA